MLLGRKLFTVWVEKVCLERYLFIRNGKETGKAVLLKQLQHKVAEDTGAYCGTLQQIIERGESGGVKK
jgi:hypothetical protein